MIKVFEDRELETYLGQQDLFSLKSIKKKRRSVERESLARKKGKKKQKK